MKNIFVTQSSMPEYEEYCEEIKSIWESIQLTNNGPKKKLLEEKLIQFLDADYIKVFTNGHLSLQLGLGAMGLKGEVITTPFTFISTINAIVQNGLTPVFCDIEEDNYTLDPRKIEDLITEKTCAILPVHVYGKVCNVDDIQKIADKHGLKVIYDAAHVFGVKYKGKSITQYGDMSMLSFHATKVFNTIEGGALIFHDPALESKLLSLQNFGLSDEDAVYIGTNAKMNEFQAAMGLCNLRHIEQEIAKRKHVCEKYMEKLAEIPEIVLPQKQQNVEDNYAYFPVVFKNTKIINRDVIAKKLKEEGIFARKYFYPLVSDMAVYRNTMETAKTPIARKISENILCLPMYSDLADEDIEKICSLIRRLYSR